MNKLIEFFKEKGITEPSNIMILRFEGVLNKQKDLVYYWNVIVYGNREMKIGPLKLRSKPNESIEDFSGRILKKLQTDNKKRTKPEEKNESYPLSPIDGEQYEN